MQWKRCVDSLRKFFSFAKETYQNRVLLQKRPTKIGFSCKRDCEAYLVGENKELFGTKEVFVEKKFLSRDAFA